MSRLRDSADAATITVTVTFFVDVPPALSVAVIVIV